MESKVKHIEVYSNGVAKIQFEDEEEMIVDEVHYWLEARLTGYKKEDIGVKK